MLQFSKRLASKGLKVTLLSTNSIVKSMDGQASSVTIEPIADNSGENPTVETMVAYIERFKVMFSHSLEDLIERNKSIGYATKLVVYDSILPWALEVAKQHGVGGAPFTTQSCTIAAIYYHLFQGRITLPLQVPEVSLPSLPLLRIDDMPSFISQPDLYPLLLRLCVDEFHNFHEVNWVFCSSFDKLEEEVVSWISSQWPIKNIGPTIPSMYLDKRLKDDKNYDLSLFKPNVDACMKWLDSKDTGTVVYVVSWISSQWPIKNIGPTIPSMYLDKRLKDDKNYDLSLFKPNVDACMKWLDSKDTGTVVYVSFGSLAALGEEQMEELALGLKRSNKYFLWVVRETETKKLPTNFIKETTERALSLGVPMVTMPQWNDQTTNSKFVMDVWKVGIRVKADAKGMVTKEEIELCINEAMGEKREELKRNATKWKKLANEALDEGGSSDKNINEFVEKIMHT
nr:udp-glycosyltransferase 74e2 [Quercus suber]